jgi:thioredoxin-like negative regulator of GroEL
MTDLLQQAVELHRANDVAGAERLYREALAIGPDRADARYNLGLIYGQQGRPVDAVRELTQATVLKPDFGEAWFMLCEFADQTGQQDVNLAASEQAINFLPDHSRAWLRRGLALSRACRHEAAIDAYRRATALDPQQIKAWINLCVACKNLGRLDKAEAAIRAAIAAAGIPLGTDNDAEDRYTILHWHLALLSLLQGDYKNGFAWFRARFKGGTDWQRLPTARPLWRGEDPRGLRIIVTAEQGAGDVLMMARYLPLLKQRGATVLFQVPSPLLPLFTNWPGADWIGAAAPADTDFDLHVPIFDLPYRFGTVLDTIPAMVPYLPVPLPDAATQLPQDGRRKIALVWNGNPAHANDAKRSLPLPLLVPLFADKNLAFYSLNRDMRAGDEDILAQHGVENLSPRIKNFADSAKFINQMDLIITCDTATAHQAGGMGKPVWTLLPFAPDWRWLTGHDDSPWYPTMRLFRQTEPENWANVIARVKTELAIRIT